MTEAESKILAQMCADFKGRGEIAKAEVVRAVRRKFVELAKPPAPPKPVPQEPYRKPWPPARRHSDAVMLFGEAR